MGKTEEGALSRLIDHSIGTRRRFTPKNVKSGHRKTVGIHAMVKNRKWEKIQELCSFTPDRSLDWHMKAPYHTDWWRTCKGEEQKMEVEEWRASSLIGQSIGMKGASYPEKVIRRGKRCICNGEEQKT